MELVIFRLVQECVTNIHRHSASKIAWIGLSRESDRVTLEIRDDGKGISRERLTEIQSGRSGVGITGMRERLRQLDRNAGYRVRRLGNPHCRDNSGSRSSRSKVTEQGRSLSTSSLSVADRL